jgi:hypothetical protein
MRYAMGLPKMTNKIGASSVFPTFIRGCLKSAGQPLIIWGDAESFGLSDCQSLHFTFETAHSAAQPLIQLFKTFPIFHYHVVWLLFHEGCPTSKWPSIRHQIFF